MSVLEFSAGLGATTVLALVALSFLTSLITATFSLGGSLLISAMREKVFRLGFRILLSLVAVGLIWRSLG